jgi:hypothetical protein
MGLRTKRLNSRVCVRACVCVRVYVCVRGIYELRDAMQQTHNSPESVLYQHEHTHDYHYAAHFFSSKSQLAQLLAQMAQNLVHLR